MMRGASPTCSTNLGNRNSGVFFSRTFLRAPIYSRDARSPTVYGAVYRPAALTVEYLWPGHATTQRIGSFAPFEYVHDYGALETSV